MDKTGKIIQKRGFTPLEIKKKCYELFQRFRSKKREYSNITSNLRSDVSAELSLTGFTLIELLVVVIIVGVLSALTVPMFRQNIRRVMATEGHALVGSIKTAQRIYFAENNKYTSSRTDIEDSIDISNNRYFKTASILSASGTGSEAVFTATVIGTGDASQISVSINEEGVMTTEGL